MAVRAALADWPGCVLRISAVLLDLLQLPTAFVGLDNYKTLFADDVFWVSVRNTMLYTVLAVPTGLLVGVLTALLLNVKSKAQGVYRVVAFIPTLVPAVAVGIIWQWLLNSQFGIVNDILWRLAAIEGPPWFGSEFWAKPSLMLISWWTIGTTVLTYLAGLQDIPTDYYEAATIDGAGGWNKAMHITLPLLTPVIFFNIIMGIISALQMFTLAFVITNGQGTPANSMLFYSMYLYKNAFSYFKMGIANAMAWIMFLVIMTLTIFVYRTSGKWVHYMGE
jgi:multiple sugar transport system permease protein